MTAKAKRWTTIIMTVAGTLSGLAVLSVETCGAIRRAQREADQVEKKAEGGYETLAPAVKELQGLVVSLGTWATEVDEERAKLQQKVHDLELKLARHEGYFDTLKERNRRLERTPKPTLVLDKPKAQPKLGHKRPTKPVPDTLNQAQQLRAE
jgi:hypothetical protein